MRVTNKVTVKIKKLHPDAVIPQYAHKGNAGFDEGKSVAYHTLVTNYRGWFSDHADNVGETVDKLREGS